MATMTLLSGPTSPYVRKVAVLLHEVGLIDQVTLQAGSGTPLAPNPQTKAHNPLGKIPCLIREGGPALFDSRVICAYLDSLHAKRKMIPDGEARWRVMTLEALADGMTDAALLVVYEARLRPAELQFDAYVEGQRGKIRDALDVLESRHMADLAGPTDLGQIAVGCALAYLDFRKQVGDWREGRPMLARWYEGFAARPSMMATAPKE